MNTSSDVFFLLKIIGQKSFYLEQKSYICVKRN